MIRLHDFPDNAPRCYFCGVSKGDAEAHPETITCIARPEPRADGGRKVSALDDVDALRERIAAIKAEAGETATCLTQPFVGWTRAAAGCACHIYTNPHGESFRLPPINSECTIHGRLGEALKPSSLMMDQINGFNEIKTNSGSLVMDPVKIYFIARNVVDGVVESREDFEARRVKFCK